MKDNPYNPPKPRLKLMFSISGWFNRRRKKKKKLLGKLQERLKERKRQHGWDI